MSIASHGPRPEHPGPSIPARASRPTAHGPRPTAHDQRTADGGRRTGDHGPRPTASGRATTGHGRRTGDHGPRTAAHGRRATAHDHRYHEHHFTAHGPRARNLARESIRAAPQGGRAWPTGGAIGREGCWIRYRRLRGKKRAAHSGPSVSARAGLLFGLPCAPIGTLKLE